MCFGRGFVVCSFVFGKNHFPTPTWNLDDFKQVSRTKTTDIVLLVISTGEHTINRFTVLSHCDLNKDLYVPQYLLYDVRRQVCYVLLTPSWDEQLVQCTTPVRDFNGVLLGL